MRRAPAKSTFRGPRWLSLVLRVQNSCALSRDTGPFTRLSRGHPRLLCLASHERDAWRRSHAASGCQAHLRGKNVIPLMAAERARRGKPTTSAASSFGSNA